MLETTPELEVQVSRLPKPEIIAIPCPVCGTPHDLDIGVLCGDCGQPVLRWGLVP